MSHLHSISSTLLLKHFIHGHPFHDGLIVLPLPALDHPGRERVLPGGP